MLTLNTMPARIVPTMHEGTMQSHRREIVIFNYLEIGEATDGQIKRLLSPGFSCVSRKQLLP